MTFRTHIPSGKPGSPFMPPYGPALPPSVAAWNDAIQMYSPPAIVMPPVYETEEYLTKIRQELQHYDFGVGLPL